MSLEKDKSYKLSELSAITGIPHSTLRLYARSGELKTTRIGKLWRVSGADAIELLNQRQIGTPEKDVLKNIDLTDIECRIADLYENVTGKTLENDQRDEVLSILEDFMRAALERRTPKPEPIPPADLDFLGKEDNKQDPPKRKPMKL